MEVLRFLDRDVAQKYRDLLLLRPCRWEMEAFRFSRMDVALDFQVLPSGHGSNELVFLRDFINRVHIDVVRVREQKRRRHGWYILNDPASMVDLDDVVFRVLVNQLRPLMAQAANYQVRERIRNLAALFDQRLFNRAVYGSCKQIFSDYPLLQKFILRMLLPRMSYMSILLGEAFEENELKYVTEMICSLDPLEIPQIKGIYPSLIGRELKDDIENFTVGKHRKLLLHHINILPGNADVGEERLEQTVSYLHKKVGETLKFPQLDIMNCVYGLSENDLRNAVARYGAECGRPLVEDLAHAGYDHFVHGLVTKIECTVNRPAYHAEKLINAFGAMRDPNVQGIRDIDHQIDYETIVRVITTVPERDMIKLKDEYLRRTGFALEDDISEAFAGCPDHLQLIHLIYNMATLYDRELSYQAVYEHCNQEFSDDPLLRRFMLGKLLPRECCITILLHEAIQENDLICVTEKICSLDAFEISQIKGIYLSLFGRELKDDIENFTVGKHRKLLLHHINVLPGNADVGEERLEQTVSYLHKKVGETLKFPQLDIMNCVYGLSENDLRNAVARYGAECGRPLVEDLALAGYDHFVHGLVTKIECTVNRPAYHAEKLINAFGAMRDPNIEGMIDTGHQIDYETIVRVITTVPERDMIRMKEEYHRRSGFTLEDDISEAFADRKDYKQLILLILNGDAPN